MFTRCAVIFLIAFRAICGALAANSPISAEVQPLTLRPRNEAPIFVEIKLHSQSRALLEGALRLQIHGASRQLFNQEIPDLVLMPGNTTQHLLLPPARELMPEEVHLQFATRSESYDLGRFPLSSLSITALRHYVIAICRGSLERSADQSVMWRVLRFEHLFPDAGRNYMSSIQTSPAWLAPEDLPTPPGLCAFDTIVLEGGGLAALGEKQLIDLTTWVEAGGSLCVVAPSAIDAVHLAFLNRLAASSRNPNPLARDAEGAWFHSTDHEKASAPSEPFLFRRPALGRFVFAFQAPSDESAADDPGWRKATSFLAHSEGEGLTVPAVEASLFGQTMGSRGRMASPSYSSDYRTTVVEQLLMKILPQSVRIIPLSLIVSVFTVFIVVAGPGEWFVLGWLRRRRWTWLTFPLLAIACTYFMVRAAEHYLGTGDQRSSLIITDFSPQGNALRENRFDLWLAGRNQDAVTEAKQALVVPCSTEDSYPGMYAYSNNPNPSYPRLASAAFFPVYQGRVPGHYTVRRPLTQWTPYIQRTLTFAPKREGPHLHWEALQKVPPPPADFLSVKNNYGAEKYISEKIGAEGWNVQVFRSSFEKGTYPTYMDSLTLGAGLPSVTAFSPSPRADLLDLILDHGPEDWIVVATRQEGQKIYLQRCVYHFNADE